MEIVTFRKSLKINESFNVYSLGDIHEGNCNHHAEALKQAVKIIREDPNGYWIGMGDYIDAITHDDKKRFNPITISEKYKLSDLKDLPVKQMEFVFDAINSIQSKCIALLCGNHEESYTKNNSNDVYERFTEMFASSAWGSVPPKRLGYVGCIRYTIEKANTVTHFVNHGNGVGGLSAGYPVTKLWQMSMPFEFDVFWMAHIHQLIEDDRKIISISNRGQLHKKRKFVGCTGSFLETYNEGHANYFEHKGRGEGDIGMLRLNIKLNRKCEIILSQEKIKLG